MDYGYWSWPYRYHSWTLIFRVTVAMINSLVSCNCCRHSCLLTELSEMTLVCQIFLTETYPALPPMCYIRPTPGKWHTVGRYTDSLDTCTYQLYLRQMTHTSDTFVQWYHLCYYRANFLPVIAKCVTPDMSRILQAHTYFTVWQINQYPGCRSWRIVRYCTESLYDLCLSCGGQKAYDKNSSVS